MEFPVLWSGLTHSVLGASVNSTGLIKIVNCAIKQFGKKSRTKCSKSAFEYIYIENALYKCNPLPLVEI